MRLRYGGVNVGSGFVARTRRHKVTPPPWYGTLQNGARDGLTVCTGVHAPSGAAMGAAIGVAGCRRAASPGGRPDQARTDGRAGGRAGTVHALEGDVWANLAPGRRVRARPARSHNANVWWETLSDSEARRVASRLHRPLPCMIACITGHYLPLSSHCWRGGAGACCTVDTDFLEGRPVPYTTTTRCDSTRGAPGRIGTLDRTGGKAGQSRTKQGKAGQRGKSWTLIGPRARCATRGAGAHCSRLGATRGPGRPRLAAALRLLSPGALCRPECEPT